MISDFHKILKERRTYYGIGKEKVVSEDRVEELLKEAVKYCPTSFNSQSPKVVVLFDDKHEKLWDITMEVLKGVVPEENLSSTEDKINSFKKGYGTILFFNDDAVTQEFQQQYPLYRDNFPVWAEQANGMLQYSIWLSLEAEGLGASLQHYNPLIDQKVKNEWNIPVTWDLIAQMPFGSREEEPGEKDFQPIDERVKVFN